MKQLYIKCIIFAILTLWSITAFSYNCQVDGIYYNLDYTTKTASVTSGSPKYSGAVTIPSTITYSGTTYSVTSIGIYAFEFCSSLSSVEIPSSVTRIGSSAFQECRGLTSVTIPNSVTSIGDYAFAGCSGLTSIEMSSSVTSISYYAFAGCTSLTSLVIPSGVTRIEGGAFRDCSGLTSVTIGKGVTDISYNTFSGCSKLYTVTINSNYLLSKKNLYSEYNNLNYWFGSQVTNYVIGTNVTSISSGVFDGCTGLTSLVVESGNSVFDSRNNCNAIIETASNTLIAGCKNTKIPSSVTSIGNSAFSGSDLTSIEIPSSVTSIGVDAFAGCSGLTSIDIPSSVTSIGNSAFSGSGLTSVEIPSSVMCIGDSAFYCCRGLISVTIPNSVTSIGERAFAGCYGLTSVTIPNSVTSIGNGTFSGCSGLTSVTIPNSVTSIGDWAFSYCSGLTSIAIPSSVTSFGFNAFSGSGLTSVEIPSSVTTIRDWAFYFCRDLTSVILGNGVTTIGKSAFSECRGLTSISIPSSLTTIDSLAFYKCIGLTSVEIPSSVTRIEGGAFRDCSGLTSVEIPSSVTRIEGSVFSGCSGLSSVVIPSSVISIGDRAFYGCSGLTSITSYITKVFKTGEDAFKGCDIATLYVPKGLAIFYQSIADWNRIIKIVEGAEGCKMTMVCNAKGVVLVNDVTAFTNKIAEMEIKDNEENTFVFIPRENCMLDEVTLNGLDVLSLVEDNTLKAVIPANSQMNVVFSKYANLTVKQGAIGYTRHAVKADAKHTIYIGSLGENKVNTVTFNGVDVTDEVVNGYYTTPEIKGESVLSISFETNSSVKSMTLNNLKVMGYNGEIQIMNIDEPSDVFVYTVDGKLVGNLPSAYGSASIQVASEDLYVVKVGSRVFKVAL